MHRWFIQRNSGCWNFPRKTQKKSVTKEAASRETIALAGLLTQAELPLLVVPLEFPGVPVDEGEELDTEDERNDDETEEGGMEDDGLGEGEGTSYMTEELELGVIEGGVPGTGVGWAGGFEMEDGGRSTISELDDPLVMVKVGEILPEFPITKLHNVSLLNKASYKRRLTGNNVRISVRVLGRNDDVHLTRSNRETLSERSI